MLQWMCDDDSTIVAVVILCCYCFCVWRFSCSNQIKNKIKYISQCVCVCHFLHRSGSGGGGGSGVFFQFWAYLIFWSHSKHYLWEPFGFIYLINKIKKKVPEHTHSHTHYIATERLGTDWNMEWNKTTFIISARKIIHIEYIHKNTHEHEHIGMNFIQIYVVFVAVAKIYIYIYTCVCVCVLCVYIRALAPKRTLRQCVMAFSSSASSSSNGSINSTYYFAKFFTSKAWFYCWLTGEKKIPHFN